MRPLSVNSTSLLKTILPGVIFIFIYFSIEILGISAGDNIQILNMTYIQDFLSPSLLILFTAIALIAGKIVNFTRLKFSRVPNYFKKTVNNETDDIKSLSRIDRVIRLSRPGLSNISNIIDKILLLNEFKKIFDVIFSGHKLNRDNTISDEYLSQKSKDRNFMFDIILPAVGFLDIKTRKQIISDMREKYELNGTTHPEIFYSIVLNDISDSKSEETREIESVYVSYKNTAISFVLAPVARIFLNIPVVDRRIIFVPILFSIFGLILLSYAGLFGIGRIYTKQILLEYHAKNCNNK